MVDSDPRVRAARLAMVIRGAPEEQAEQVAKQHGGLDGWSLRLDGRR